MLVKCVNRNCVAAKDGFLWDERPHLGKGGRVVKPREEGAFAFIALCPVCGAENNVWIMNPKHDDDVYRYV